MKLDLYASFEDKSYVNLLKSLLQPHSLSISYETPLTIAGSLGSSDAILVTNTAFIKKLTGKNKCNHEDYYGSLWERKSVTGKEVPILCIPPLKRLVSTKPGIFLCKRYLSKLFRRSEWLSPTPFSWTLCNDLLLLKSAYDELLESSYVAIDIETSPAFDKDTETPRHLITCVSYTGFFFQGNSFYSKSFVIPVSSLENLKWIRKFNSELPQPKIFQNGKYDNFYFLRFSAPVKNWLFDLMELHHGIYAELPKSLGYLGAFYLREISFWKDEGQTGNLEDLYRYCAKDSWATGNAFFAALREAPDWAIKNYLIKWPLIIPCLACELDGLRIDKQRLEAAKIIQSEKQAKALTSIRRRINHPLFNPSSPKQVLQLLHILGNKELTSSAEAELIKAGDRHPIAKVLVDSIIEYRESSKLISTYLEAELKDGKLLYTLNPSGTDTGRLASRESQLWCGTQLQNLPPYYKQTIRAEEGFFLGEGDNEQSESRCSAYLSGDENLIAAVESPNDFHATNASSFFGLSYEEIMKEEKLAKQQLVKPFTIRDLSKRVNHGATYNMGSAVLLATMGLKKVLQAKLLLGLPEKYSPKDVCDFLLKKFSDTYPTLKGPWYDSIVAAVKLTKLLTSALGWTRLCFGTPWNSKPDLNSYVAHVPSNLSVGIINEGFSDIYWKIARRSNGLFRLKGQIHDSILFAYKQGRIDLAQDAARLMQRPKQITDCGGKTRTMLIPVALKAEAEFWNELKPVKF